LSHLDFDIVSDFDIRISSLWRTFSTLVEKVRQIRLFMQNKPNFPRFSPENKDFTKKQIQFKPNFLHMLCAHLLFCRGSGGKPNQVCVFD